jgi:methionine synthase II (cobalamin-independent)
MVAQFSENLPGLKITKEGLSFSPEDNEKELEIFYERIIANDVDYFKISKDFALGIHKFYQRLEKSNLKDIEFIKCQVVGPFTFAAAVSDDKGAALLHNTVFMQAILKALAMKALWQINLFKKFGKKLILFFDEPYLGCFGSAYTPINREDVVEGLSELTQSVKSRDVLLGVHCCGNTDWSIFTQVASIDIISFDAFGFLDRLVLYADDLKAFFKRRGILCWGIVPTQEFSDKETQDLLTDKLNSGINSLIKKGIARDLILRNLLLSPSCGMGTLDIEKSKEVLETLYVISEKIRK